MPIRRSRASASGKNELAYAHAAVRIGPAPAQVLVIRDRLAGGQDLPHQPLDGRRQCSRQHLARPATETLLPGHAAEPFQGVVQPQIAQVGVEYRHPDRRPGQEVVQHGPAHRPVRGEFPSGHQEALPPGDQERGGGPYVDVQGPAVPGPQGNQPAPSRTGPAAGGHRGRAPGVRGARQQECGGPADHLGRRIPEQRLGPAGPADDRAVPGDHRRRAVGRPRRFRPVPEGSGPGSAGEPSSADAIAPHHPL